MPLTPEDVSNKRFTAVRLREGYDMGEVDQFLDEVEAELTRLIKENEELRAKVEASGGEVPAQPEPTPEPEKQPEAEAEEREPEPEQAEPEQAEPEQAEPEQAEQPEPEQPEQPQAEEPGAEEPEAGQPEQAAQVEVQRESGREDGRVETIQVTTTEDASRAATRLLELAGRNADELVAEAQQQAEKILGEARAKAESAQGEAQERAQSLDAETAERREQLMGDLEAEKQRLDQEVSRLAQFERSYRQELRDYFQQQLHSLQGDGRAASLPASVGNGAADAAEGEPQTGDPEAVDSTS